MRTHAPWSGFRLVGIGCLAGLVCLGGLAAGCVVPSRIGLPANTVQAGGLAVTVELPRRDLRTGESLRVRVTAANATRQPLTIVAPSGAPVLVSITRPGRLLTEVVKTYPQSATTNILSWTLPAGATREFVLMVPVEPDWPVNEVLYLTAELNGYPKAAPSVAVVVRSLQK